MLWRPEYAAYMIEGTPGRPFGHLPEYLNVVEYDMRRRRQLVQKRLPANCYILCLTAFPRWFFLLSQYLSLRHYPIYLISANFRLGCPNFTYPPARATPDSAEAVSRSLFFPDAAIFPGHPRFKYVHVPLLTFFLNNQLIFDSFKDADEDYSIKTWFQSGN